MITLPNGKICMNEQEAIQWLLDNYPIPFQCSANYAPLTEIGLGTIVNPTPAKVKVGSIIFFADSKVSTVVGVTPTGFICSDQYNDLVDDVVYVSNVAINASGHLIVTLSNGENIDAGLIKQVANFSINASQHLIVTYNDGSTNDLGAIFNGNINVAGNFTANSIIENMVGYSFTSGGTNPHITRENIYAGIVKNGNKLTIVGAVNLTRTDLLSSGEDIIRLGIFDIPSAVADALYPTTVDLSDYLDLKNIKGWKSAILSQAVDIVGFATKGSGNLSLWVGNLDQLELNVKTYIRYEVTLLLSNNLAA